MSPAAGSPTPGTRAFRSALVASLQQVPELQGRGAVHLATEQRVSRNTLIYRCRVGSDRIVAKVQTSKPAAVVVAEYHMLREMRERLPGPDVRGLRPVALLESLGVLVTQEEDGESLRSVLEAACAHPEEEWARAVEGVRAAAGALRRFHGAFGVRNAPGPAEGDAVRCYLDFSPKNVLIDRAEHPSEPAVVLMDPPEEERWGARSEDVGGFCFDLTRIRFLPRFVWKPAVSRRLDRLKACFIHHYYAGSEADPARILDQVKAADRRRASQALEWYLTPWRYPSLLKETARLCYLGPLTAGYRAWGVGRSYGNVGRIWQCEASK